MDGWVNGKAGLRIAYSNQKSIYWLFDLMSNSKIIVNSNSKNKANYSLNDKHSAFLHFTKN